MAQIGSSEFQRAFAAVSYLGGRRDSALLAPFRAVHDDARAFVRRMAHPERERRAEALASELARINTSLEARAIK